ncbi:MAG TPA: hypothetical protein VNZ55_01735, partial [Thermomicrobiales bacterium]|nr:hypothetical protein [Thermomicrobiales bacterium]
AGPDAGSPTAATPEMSDDVAISDATPVEDASVPTPESASPVASPEATTEPTLEATTEPTLIPASPEPTQEVTIEPTLIPASPEPTLEPTLAPTVAPAVAYINGTDGDGAFCRTSPDADGEIIALLPEGTELLVTGAPDDDWRAVTCNGVDGFVFAEFVSPEPPAPESAQTPVPTATTTPDVDPTDGSVPTPADVAEQLSPTVLPTEVGTVMEETSVPTAEPTFAPTVEPTFEPTVEPTLLPTLEPTLEPTIEPTPEPEVVTRDLVIDVASDTSVTAESPDTPQSGEQGVTLTAGGESGASTVLTFNVEGVGAGTVVNARLVLTGSGETAGTGGELLVAPGVWFDEYGVTRNQVDNTGLASAGWIDYIQPGVETSVDVSGIVTGDGTVSFVIPGTPDQVVGIASRESGAPAYLVLTVEELVYPDGGM